MSEKNLLIPIDGDFVGGAETNYRFILPALRNLGWNAIFLAPTDVNLRSYFGALGIPLETRTGLRTYRPFSIAGRVSVSNVLRVFWDLKFNRRLVNRFIEEIRPAAVVSNSMVSHLLNAGLPPSLDYRRVIHLHDIVDRTRLGGLYGKGLDWISRKADAIVTISDAVISTLPAVGRAKSRKLYNPIGPTPTRRRQFGPPLRVGMFARYTPWKGHRDLLRIVEACKETPIEFVSFGNVSSHDARYYSELSSDARKFKGQAKLQISGFVADPLCEMADCDVVLHLSTSPEPFGRVLIEANACGVPVIAYRGGGVDELFDELRLEGERVACGDWRSVADVVKRASASVVTKVEPVRVPNSIKLLSADRYVERFLEICHGENLYRRG